MKIAHAMSQTDWKLLKEQKQCLVQLLVEPNRLFPNEQTALQGLLNWIDAVQDAAEIDGFPVEWLDK